MWGKAGNAVDQALLLGALLDEAAIPWRFAVGALGDERVAELLDGARFEVEAERKRLAQTVLRPSAAESWTGDGTWARDPEVDQILSEARTRMDESVLMLEQALSAAGIDEVSAAAGVPELERAEHVWVQYADGPHWIDLDPAFPSIEAGTSAATATSTPSEIPDDLFHTVTFRASAEVMSGGVPVRTQVLSHTVRSADVAGVPVMVVHPGAEWLGVAAAITGSQQYVPTFIVGEQIVEGSIIALSSGGGALEALGDESTAEGQALAEWLEVDIAVPGASPKTFTRTIFDRLGVERRAAGTIDVSELAPIELVEITELGSVYLPLAGALTITVAAQPTPWSFFADDPTTVDDVGTLVQSAHGFQFLRDVLRLETIGQLDTRFFEDEPNVVAWWTAAGAAATQEGVQAIAVAADVIHAHRAAIGGAGAAGRSGVVAAALDHAAERMVLEGTTALLPEQPDVKLVSVGGVFEAAAQAGIDVVTLTGPDGAIPAVGVFASDLIRAALDAGRVVVIPERPVEIHGAERIGWWEVDPVSGHVVDRLDDGRGAELGEYMMMVHHMAAQMACLLAIGWTIGAIAAAAQGYAGAWQGAMVSGAIAFGQCALGFAGGGH